jgi:NAD(P)-dependent dehydrogenase (short-subunit alcohol dehydrogenase family)
MLAYSASKAGVNAIMDGLRVELAPVGILTTTVCPGWIRTPLTANIEGKLDHLLDADDAAREIVYAIRKKKSFYTFPRQMRWGLQFLTKLPRSWQDWYITRRMNGLHLSNDKQAPG